MNTPRGNDLDRLFHEPNRLAIMSALCAADGPAPFNELKAVCGLTDGNLNRHVCALRDAGAVRIHKRFEGLRPLTTIEATPEGIESFNAYLDRLTVVLKQARRASRGHLTGVKPCTATHAGA